MATTTPTLFEQTLTALESGSWSLATKLLDDLARSGNVESIWPVAGAPATVQDRIELVNARAEEAVS